MLKQLQKNNKGFTIIEVMIVLAIAGLIILVVLLAIPALQRNGRNTALKSDAAALAAGVGEFASNNDGALPTVAGSPVASGTIILNNASGSPTTVKIQGSTKYTPVAASASSQTPAAGEVIVMFGAKCNTISGASATPAISARATAIIYAVEQAGANQAKCLDA